MDDVGFERALSSTLFGARYRLEVAGILQSGETVSAPQVEARLASDVPRSSVQMELRHLRNAGLLRVLDRTPGSRIVEFHVAETPFWDAARHLISDETLRVGARANS